jgi:hypothetical protein
LDGIVAFGAPLVAVGGTKGLGPDFYSGFTIFFY